MKSVGPFTERLKSGVRRAMAEVVIMKLETQDALHHGAPGNFARRARIKTLEVLYNRLNRILIEP